MSRFLTTVRRTARRASWLLALMLAMALAATPSAFAHAQLLGTSPISGSTVQTQPREVIFEFNQNVGGTAGAVRVYDSQGAEVDNLDVSHPDGNEHWMGVGLKSNLPDGTYTATYRVISADTHIVYGGLVFNLGHASASSKVTVAGLISRNQSGHVTDVAFGVVRALNYLTLALMTGGLAFLLLIWPRALASSGVGGERAAQPSRGAWAGCWRSRSALASSSA
jgi:copper transport protein